MPHTLEQKREHSRKRRREFAPWLAGIKLRRGCERCGARPTDPVRLIFHHRDPAGKQFDVGRMRGYARPRVECEIAKCDVLCRQCHNEVHGRANGTTSRERWAKYDQRRTAA